MAGRVEAIDPGSRRGQGRGRSGAPWPTSTGCSAPCSTLVDIDEGWEAAFEAAVGEALAAVVDRRRRELDPRRLRSWRTTRLTGAVIALGVGGRMRMVPLGHRRRGPRPTSGDRAPTSSTLLDALVGACGRCRGPLGDAVGGALAKPGRRWSSTRSGDRFGSDRLAGGGDRVAGPPAAALDEARAEAGAGPRLATARRRRRPRLAVGREAARRACAKHEAQAEPQEARTRERGRRIDRRPARPIGPTRADRELEDREGQLVESGTGVPPAGRRHRTAGSADELPALEAEEAEHAEPGGALASRGPAWRNGAERRAAEPSSRSESAPSRGAASCSAPARSTSPARAARSSGSGPGGAGRRARAVAVGRRRASTTDWASDLAGRCRIDRGAGDRAGPVGDRSRGGGGAATTRGERAEAEKELAELRERRARLELGDRVPGPAGDPGRDDSPRPRHRARGGHGHRPAPSCPGGRRPRPGCETWSAS